MNRLFPSPLYTFFKQIKLYGGLQGKGYLHAALWFLKLLITEPLRWIETISTQKKINDIVINKPPVFIIGYYRSGTTFLQRMFMQDARLGFMSLFQTIFPELIVCFEKMLTPLLERLGKFMKVQNPFHNIPLTWYSPGEEDVALTSMISIYGIQWGFLFPERMQLSLKKYVVFDEMNETEKKAWSTSYLYLLKKISYANNHRQLVLKNPPNMMRIKCLLSLFPDAKFIYIQRNPFNVYASNKKMLQMIQKKYVLGKAGSVNFTKLIMDMYTCFINQYQKDKILIPARQLCEIQYEDFIGAPMQRMQTIYETLQLGDFSFCRNDMERFVKSEMHYPIMQHKISDSEKIFIQKKCELLSLAVAD